MVAGRKKKKETLDWSKFRIEIKGRTIENIFPITLKTNEYMPTKKELKRRLVKLSNDILTLVMKPESSEASLIKTNIKIIYQLEKMLWTGEVTGDKVINIKIGSLYAKEKSNGHAK